MKQPYPRAGLSLVERHLRVEMTAKLDMLDKSIPYYDNEDSGFIPRLLFETSRNPLNGFGDLLVTIRFATRIPQTVA